MSQSEWVQKVVNKINDSVSSFKVVLQTWVQFLIKKKKKKKTGVVTSYWRLRLSKQGNNFSRWYFEIIAFIFQNK